MHRFLYLLTCAAGAGLAFVACGGVGGQNLFGTGGAGGAGVTGSTSSSSNSSSSSGTGGATSSGGTGGATSSSSSSGDGPASSSSSTTSGSTTTTSSSSSSSGQATGVLCGSVPAQEQQCPSDEVCCFDTAGNDDHCATHHDCATATGFISIPCMGPDDCNGQICCADVNLDMQDPYLSVSCAPTCDNLGSRIVLCAQGGGPDQSVCPANYTCQQSTVLDAGYYVCNPN